MNNFDIVKMAFMSVIDYPLEKFVADDSYFITKVISAVAIAILSCTIIYAVHAYNFFAHRKVISLYRELVQAVKRGDHDRSRELLQQAPALKQYLDVYISKEGVITQYMARLIPTAIRNNDLDMVKILHENGASLNVHCRVGSLLEQASELGHLEIIKYLIENGVQLDAADKSMMLAAQKSNLDVVQYLAQQGVDVNEGGFFSVLYTVGLGYDKDPDKCLETIEVLLDKGAQLRDPSREDPNLLPDEVIALIQSKAAAA